ncbi:MAG: AAA family ATPase [Eubacteriales bacterium]|nr:AAA family ATPase [Eubacteriales bacterium]
MIKKLKINQYRKLKNLELDFSPNLNVVSGTNGTCKTSLLHLISNSFQAVTTGCDWVNDKKCLSAIKSINDITNPKVESLTRGDKKYNDPAHGISGILFSAEYYSDKPTLDFRRHNSQLNSRYAIKPQYQKGSGDKLPFCPIVYLGIPRLVPFGEYKNDESITKIKNGLPKEYQEIVSKEYEKFTHYNISEVQVQQLGDIKKRSEFSSNFDGIDSNTISAGEDNLYIILTALISLRYYYENIQSRNQIESILLIDELDATLHPAFQLKLLSLFRKYSQDYKIQIIFTSHSMSVLEDMLEKKDNVLYLLDNMTSVVRMEDPDIFKIKMHLTSLTHEDIYLDKNIPIYTEDPEARFMLDGLFSYFEENKPEFAGVRRFFYVPEINMGADSLADMFKDVKLLRSTMRAICVLDGDHGSDLSNNIISLPGKNYTGAGKGLSPEELLFEYAQMLFDNDDPFWVEKVVINQGYSKATYLQNIKSPIDEFHQKKDSGEMSQKPREFNKKLFNHNRGFFVLLFKHWLHNEANRSEKHRFYTELHKLFLKNALYNEINPNEWK